MNISKILTELRSERERIDRAIAAIEAITSPGTPPSARSKPTAVKPRRRSRMSAAGRRKMSALMKARWAERKKKAKS